MKTGCTFVALAQNYIVLLTVVGAAARSLVDVTNYISKPYCSFIMLGSFIMQWRCSFALQTRYAGQLAYRGSSTLQTHMIGHWSERGLETTLKQMERTYD